LEAFLADERENDQDLTALINSVLADEAATRTPEQAAEDEALEAWLDEAGRRSWDSVEWKE
jgi:hypothetical protein